jgi:hypothetical protein
MRDLLTGIPPRPGRICCSCIREVADCPHPESQYADRSGDTYCRDCATSVTGNARAGFDCAICDGGLCGCAEGDPGCPHFQCLAFAVGGIIPDEPGPRYASCPGAARRVVEVREQSAALKLAFARLLADDARQRLFGCGRG